MGKTLQHMPALFSLLACVTANATELQSAMEQDPHFRPQEVVHTVPKALFPLWLDILDNADVEMEAVCKTAQGLIRCHRLGIPVESDVIAGLVRQLHRQDLTQAARLAVARALVELDAREFTAQLVAALPTGGRDMAEIVEPALAAWGDRSLQQEWLARLEDPQTQRRDLHLAIRGVGGLRESAAYTQLLRIVADASQPLSLRIEAAKSVARVKDAGLEPDVERVLATKSTDPSSALLAVYMLARHSGPRAEQLQMTLADNQDAAVAAAAVETLIDSHANFLQPKLQGLLHSSDATMRRLGVRAARLNPAAGIRLLGEVLDDHHLDVRRAAGEALIEIGCDAERREVVCQQAASMLDADFPRRTERALIVLGELDFEEAAQRMLQLLDASEPTVCIAAAWALQRVADRETGEAIFNRLDLEIDRSAEFARTMSKQNMGQAPDASLKDLPTIYTRAEHLILALGQLRFARADAVLKQFIAKPNWQPGDPPLVDIVQQPRLRAAAIWALGMIHANQGPEAPADIVDALLERLADTTPIPREEPIVRRMAAISLGRTKAPAALPLLRQFADPAADIDEVRRASGWALEQVTGVPSEQGGSRIILHVDWFLVPLDGKVAEQASSIEEKR